MMSRDEWLARASAHRARLVPTVEEHLERGRTGEKHPVRTSSSATTRSPRRTCCDGTRVTASTLLDADEYVGLKGYRATGDGGARVDTSYVAAQQPLLTALHRLLARHRLAAGAHRLLRAARVGDGLPAWPTTRPATPTGRCGSGMPGTDEVVESHRIACSHFDAYRFFTAPARPLNTLTPGRDDRAAFEQPGCLHAGMDLYKHAFRLTPDDLLRPGRRLLRAGARHPGPRHARVAVRPRRPRLRAGADRDRRRQTGVRRAQQAASPSAVRRCGRG